MSNTCKSNNYKSFYTKITTFGYLNNAPKTLVNISLIINMRKGGVWKPNFSIDDEYLFLIPLKFESNQDFS